MTISVIEQQAPSIPEAPIGADHQDVGRPVDRAAGKATLARRSRPSAVVITGDVPLMAEALCVALGARGVEVHRLSVGPTSGILAATARTSSGTVVVLNPADAFDTSGQPTRGDNLVVGLVEQGKRVLLLASEHSIATAAAVASGATGLLDASMGLEALQAALTAAAAGEELLTVEERHRWLTRLSDHQSCRRAERDRRWQMTQRLRRLTARERQVLDLLGQGHRAAVIAEQLLVSLSTVRAQIRSILVKLEVSSQLQAVAAMHFDDIG